MIKKFSFFTAILILLSLRIVAQPFNIFGKVVDDSTKAPIPFASVAISGLNLGTSTNINGEFLIRLDSLPADLIFSHVSYDKQEISVQSVNYITISLLPRRVILEELVIEEKDIGEYPYRLIIQALNKAVQKSRDWKYGLAYYRQTSKNIDEYSELYEIFYDTRYSSKGIMDWDIQEGRYAMTSGERAYEYVFNKNFTLLTRLVTMFQPETDKFIMPVNENVREFYYLNISDLTDVEGRKVAAVHFTPKENISIPAMEGKIFIDIENYDIIKLVAQIKNDNLEIIALTNPKGSWKNFVLNIEAAYNPNGEEMLLDYISMHQSFDYHVEGQFQHTVETNSFLTYYEYYQPDKFKRLGGRLMRIKKSDREILNRVGYNKRFWDENPIVLRTPVEEEIISSFESSNAFGTIYLNDRLQIQLDKDELAKDPFVQQLNIDLQKAKIASFGEKVYIHFDKPLYASGETIWFNTYIVNIGSLILTDKSGVLYVDLISPFGDVLMNKRLMVTSGTCEGSLDIPKDLESGNYRIRAYTNWMKNYDESFFFDKQICIYSTSDDSFNNKTKPAETKDFDLQFFPEGGHLIHNLTAQVAFKAIDENGNGIEINGKVIGADGKSVADFKTRHDGMGSFFLNPQINIPYRASVKYGRIEKEFDFPVVLNEGYAVTVNNLKDRNMQLMIKSSPTLNDTELYVIAQSRGIMIHREKVKLKRGVAVVSIPKAKFPDGIAQITIFNLQHIPIIERLVFINNQQTVTASIETDNEIINPRDKISLKLMVKDQYGKAVRNTSFSLAVTDADHLIKDDARETIKTNLLLTSDLKGNISNPGFYFKEDDRNMRIAIDLIMLTHGWRRFTWETIMDESFAQTSFAHENGIHISGMALSSSNKPVSNTFLKFIPLNNEFFSLWETTTGIDGRFEFKGLIIPDSTAVVAKSVNKKGRNEDVSLLLDLEESSIPTLSYIQQVPLQVNNDILKYIDHQKTREIAYALNDNEDKVILKEMIIQDSKIRPESIHAVADNVIIMDEVLENYNDIFQVIQGRVPGVMVTGQGMHAKVLIRGVNSINLDSTPLFIVDGMALNTPTASMGGDSLDANSNTSPSFINTAIMSISPRDVEMIEVLKGASASIYGLRGANGVIAIYTKRGPSVSEHELRGITDDILYLPGFHVIKEFYAPKYDNQDEDNSKPDKRTTIYWNPSVKTNNLGYANITFYNSDDGETLQLDLEGITDYGDPVELTTLIGQGDTK